MYRLLILADDRTGAHETAGVCVDLGLPPVQVVTGGPCDERLVVINGRSRHVTGPQASDIVAQLAAVSDRQILLKMDSTLRGNWAHEVVALAEHRRQSVLVVPSLPALGRTCSGGIVRVAGTPASSAAALDVRGAPTGSRPGETLKAAGARSVVELANHHDVAAWLARPSTSVAVADAVSTEELRRIGSLWAESRNIGFAGTSAALGYATVARLGSSGQAGAPPRLEGPIIVVNGSQHLSARTQINRLAVRGVCLATIPGAIPTVDGQSILIVQTPAVERRTRVSPAEAEAMSRHMAEAVGTLEESCNVMIILGGDTADAIVGDATIDIRGLVAPGTPWGQRADGRGPVIVTRSGGFGGPDALVELLSDRLSL